MPLLIYDYTEMYWCLKMQWVESRGERKTQISDFIKTRLNSLLLLVVYKHEQRSNISC